MNINGIILSDESLNVLRRMQEDGNSEIDNVLEGLDCIAELIENPEADASDGDRLVMLQQLRGVRKILKDLKHLLLMSQNNETKMDSYITALMAVYSPATNESDATHWFSTEDVYEAIKKIDPGTSVSLEDVYNSLLMGGFRFQPRPGTLGCEFRWMFKQK